MVNDHTRSAENWKCVWYLLRLYIYIRVYVDSHSLGQLALASKRTASKINFSVDLSHCFFFLKITRVATFSLDFVLPDC